MTTSLELGCDCLGEIRYLDAVLHDSAGEPQTVSNAICIHEEDNAVLWKHVDERAGAEVRRMRRLVVSFHVTVANYEYLVYWRFYQDGNIECEVRATGIMVTTPFAGRRRAAVRHGRRHADLRADPPALPHRPPRHGGRRAGQHRRHVRDRAAADRPGQPVRPRARPALGAARHRGRLRLRLVHPARLEGHQPERAQQGGHRRGLQARRRAPRCRRCSTRARRCCAAPGCWSTRCGSPRTPARSAGRAASS